MINYITAEIWNAASYRRRGEWLKIAGIGLVSERDVDSKMSWGELPPLVQRELSLTPAGKPERKLRIIKRPERKPEE
jgi:hypothetical protein